jgi:superfamily II DNA or RNA helicase
MEFYPEDNFDNVLEKFEFRDDPRREYIYQEPRQLLVRNYISKYSPYESILLYWPTGAGKTAGAITIAEGLKETVANMGRKIMVLVKNENIEKNIRNEMLSHVTENEYINDAIRDKLMTGDFKEIRSKINRKINKTYEFKTYRTFVNQVLGMKEFEKDVVGFNTKKKKRDIQGEEVRKEITSRAITDLSNTVIIIDEAHNIKGGDFYKALEKVLRNSINYRLVLLTATPMYDSAKEIIYLSNILNMNDPSKLIPIKDKDLYKGSNAILKRYNPENSKLLKGEVIQLTEYGQSLLRESLAGKVSNVNINTDFFPEKIDLGKPILKQLGSIKVINCEMSEHQYNIYKNSLESDADIKYNKNIISTIENIEEVEAINEDPNIKTKADSLYKNSSDVSTFVFSNGLYGKAGFESCFEKRGSSLVLKREFANTFTTELEKNSNKLFQMLNNIQRSEGNIFIYSNYVNNGGTGLIKQLLLNNGYSLFSKGRSTDYKSFIVFDDSTRIETREAQKKIFNSEENKDGKLIKIIIGSPIISEGITLKNIRQVHILEPSWNMSRLNQIIGRAIRNRSHSNLPEEKRNVEIYKYCSVYSAEPDGIFIDREKYVLSEEKDRTIKVVERLLKEIAFDCSYNTINKKYKNHTAECDYTNCKYTCEIQPTNTVDKSTYKLYIDFFDKFDIQFISNTVRRLYAKHYVWNLQELVTIIKELSLNIITNEAIYKTLYDFVENKISVYDQFNREGFLIQKGDFFIFNPNEIDINSSMFSKILDFQVNTNKYSLSEYLNVKNIKIKKSNKDSVKKSEPIEQKQLSSSEIKYNEKVMKNVIYGTFRMRRKKGEDFGKIDNKFRLVDTRVTKGSESDSEDERKNITGMEIKSYTKDRLIDVIKYLKITLDDIKRYLKSPQKIKLSDLDKEQYILVIKKHLEENNMILK